MERGNFENGKGHGAPCPYNPVRCRSNGGVLGLAVDESDEGVL